MLHFDGERYRNGREHPWFTQVGASCAIPLAGRCVDHRDPSASSAAEYEARIVRLSEVYGNQPKYGNARPRHDAGRVDRLLTAAKGNREKVAKKLGCTVLSLTCFLRQHGLMAKWKQKPGPPKGSPGFPRMSKGMSREAYAAEKMQREPSKGSVAVVKNRR